MIVGIKRRSGLCVFIFIFDGLSFFWIADTELLTNWRFDFDIFFVFL